MNVNNHLISVILPCYNVSKYVGKCINSIQKQTFQNFEIICIDDCSTDNTLKVLEEKAKRDKRVRIVKHNINKGLASGRITGINNSKGEYIAFVDPDDYIDENYLQTFLTASKKNNADLVISTGCINFIGLYKKVTVFDTKEIKLINECKYNEISHLLLKNFYGIHCFPAPVWGKLYKRELFNNLPRINVFYQEDVLMNFYVFTKNLKTITAIDYYGYHYRCGGGTSLREGYLTDNFEVYQIRKEYLLNSSLEVNLKLLYLKFLLIELKNVFYEYVLRQIIQKLPKSQIKQNVRSLLANPSVLDDIQVFNQTYELNLDSPTINAIIARNVDLIIDIAQSKISLKRKILNFITKILNSNCFLL